MQNQYIKHEGTNKSRTNIHKKTYTRISTTSYLVTCEPCSIFCSFMGAENSGFKR